MSQSAGTQLCVCWKACVALSAQMMLTIRVREHCEHLSGLELAEAHWHIGRTSTLLSALLLTAERR